MTKEIARPPAIPDPDGKDWTWVLQRRCAECGFDAGSVGRDHIAERLRASIPRWETAMVGADLGVRPAAQVWSVLEYACHVRDVNILFEERARLIQGDVDPLFANWDQDETALEKRYWDADPAEVVLDLSAGARSAASVFAGLSADRWERTGRRSNGSNFTMETLGLYYLHDVEHHLYDVGF